jgi:predicted nucleic acid-binding protein
VIVLDASAAADAVLERGEQGSWAAEQLIEAEEVSAPHLIDVEVASALRRVALARETTPGRARVALDAFLTLPLERYPTTILLDRVWRLRHHLTAYDACYIALAELLGQPVVTTDARLARARGHRAEIVAYGA